MLKILVVAMACLCVCASPRAASAQDGGGVNYPTPIICGEPDAERTLHRALNSNEYGVAIVTPLGAYEPWSGRDIIIERVISGRLIEGQTRVDARPAITCVQELVYDRGDHLLVSFILPPSGAAPSTVFGLRVQAREGSMADVTDSETPLDEIDVVTSDGTRSLDELLNAARAYIEPTPTALPPGVTPLPTQAAVDSGAGVIAPNTGAGPSASGERGRLAIGLAALALIAAAGGVIAWRRA